MKTASTDIYLLIKSLSKSEKRYFHQYASRHTIGEENQYVSLFDAIEKLQEYDETALKQQLADSPYITYFAVAKQYLYQQVLESLHAFHQAQSIEEQIKKQFHIVKILWRKKLQAQAEKELAKAKKQIDKYSLLEYLPEFSALERRLMRGKQSLTTEKVQQSYQDMEAALQVLQQNNWYWLQCNSILSMHYEKVAVQQPAGRAALETIVHRLFSAGLPEQPTLRLDYYRALATYYFMNGDAKNAADYNSRLLDLFGQYAFLIELEREQYVAALSNFLIDNHLLGNYEVVDQGIATLRQLPTQPMFRTLPNLEIKILELTYSLQLNARIAQKQFAPALGLLPDLQKAIKKHQSEWTHNHLLSFYYLMSYIYFANKQYENALIYLDLLRQSEYKNLLEELLLAADRLYLLTHFELENYLLLDGLLQSVRRAHYKQKNNTSLEYVLFKYLKKLSLATHSKKKTALYQALQTELNAVKVSNNRAWNYFDYDWWLAEKMGNG